MDPFTPLLPCSLSLLLEAIRAELNLPPEAEPEAPPAPEEKPP